MPHAVLPVLCPLHRVPPPPRANSAVQVRLINPAHEKTCLLRGFKRLCASTAPVWTFHYDEEAPRSTSLDYADVAGLQQTRLLHRRMPCLRMGPQRPTLQPLHMTCPQQKCEASIQAAIGPLFQWVPTCVPTAMLNSLWRSSTLWSQQRRGRQSEVAIQPGLSSRLRRCCCSATASVFKPAYSAATLTALAL